MVAAAVRLPVLLHAQCMLRHCAMRLRLLRVSLRKAAMLSPGSWLVFHRWQGGDGLGVSRRLLLLGMPAGDCC